MSFESVPVEKLHKRLRFAEPLNYPASSRNKPLTEWSMEIDDSPIFRYLYRSFNPKRHLEFGTWQGCGTLYCLEECGATVWTINLPFGEDDKEGGFPAYSNSPEEAAEVNEWATKVGLYPGRNSYWTDKIGFIGRLYLARNLGNRVCQIYCDSRDWDLTNFPLNFFDSVLIDGGHTPEIVMSDTRKALPLVRPGGLIMWHDFCLDETVRKDFSTPRDLVETFEANFSWIRPQLKDFFWIEPSWLAIGVKRGGSGSLSRYMRRLREALFARPTEVGSLSNGAG